MVEKKEFCECGKKLILHIDQFRGRCQKCSTDRNKRIRPAAHSYPRRLRLRLLRQSLESLSNARRCQAEMLPLAVDEADWKIIQNAAESTQAALRALKSCGRD